MTNKQIEAALAALNNKRDEITVAIEELQEQVEELESELSAYIDDRSSEWKDSDRGDAIEQLRIALERWDGSLEDIPELDL